MNWSFCSTPHRKLGLLSSTDTPESVFGTFQKVD
jgi:hypothetical protein